jgi:hypothetical protein
VSFLCVYYRQYDHLVGKERAQGGQGGRGARGAGDDMFTKKRAPAPAAGVRAPQAPMGVKYQMNPSPRKGPPQGPARGAPVGRGSGVAAVKASRTQQPMGGTFLTGMEADYEEESDLEAARRERRRQQAQASDGQRGLKQRVQVPLPTAFPSTHCPCGDSSEPFFWCAQARKARATEQASGARRHEAALKEVCASSSVHPLDQLVHRVSRSS